VWGRVFLIMRHELNKFAGHSNYVMYFGYTFGNDDTDDVS